MMKRGEMLDATESILKKAGFQVSERCNARASCFDFATRKKEKLVFIKIYGNIGNVSPRDASELHAISTHLCASSLFVGDKTRHKPLEDDTVYSRYDICALNNKTLEDVLVHGTAPLIEAGPGGYYVKLDGEKIRKRRQKLGLSIGKLAEMMGISRRTLYGYEKGMAKASVSAAYKLEWVLGVPVVQSIDIFESCAEAEGLFATARRMIIKHLFLQKVLRKFAEIRFHVAQARRAPFDFIAQCPEGKLNIIGGVPDNRERNIGRRTEEIISVSKVVNAQPIFITDDDGGLPNNNIPSICHRDFAKIQCQEDLIAQL
jgi:putative transcriptional regulator